jgi:hypothetical protein
VLLFCRNKLVKTGAESAPVLRLPALYAFYFFSEVVALPSELQIDPKIG